MSTESNESVKDYGEFAGEDLLSLGIRSLIDEGLSADNIYSIIFASDVNIVDNLNLFTDESEASSFVARIKEIMSSDAGSDRNERVRKLVKDMNGYIDKKLTQ